MELVSHLELITRMFSDMTGVYNTVGNVPSPDSHNPEITSGGASDIGTQGVSDGMRISTNRWMSWFDCSQA